jgi:ABC-2 type transport system ATP-binding protein
MRQRIGVAQALINDPDLVFMDEPTSGLDPIGGMQIREVIIKIRERGKTVFLCSHLLKEMEPLCDNVAILARGQLKAMGQVGALLAATSRSWLRPRTCPRPSRRSWPLTDHPMEGKALTAYFTDQAKALQGGGLIEQSGGTITFLGPMRRSLEEVFIEKVGEESQ